MLVALNAQNALPNRAKSTEYLTAKDAIDNGGAGRAAKGATPTTSTNPAHVTIHSRNINSRFVVITLIEIVVAILN